ncbi:MAG: hypothetical protein R2827_16795, partial [Bdellovibrionales bacterium]
STRDHYYFMKADMQYTTMCNPSTVTTSLASNNTGGLAGAIYGLGDKSYVPANIFDASPFTMRISIGYYGFYDPLRTSNTRFVYEVTLPTGYSVVGSPATTNWHNGQYPDNASVVSGAATVTYAGNVVTVTSPSSSIGWFELPIVYDCATGGGVNTPVTYKLKEINDITTNCLCNDEIFCYSIAMNPICGSSCPGGPAVTYLKVEREDNSLGWTDATLSTHQSRANISAYDLAKSLYLDEFFIDGNANIAGAPTNTNNLHIYTEIAKVNTQATDVITPLSIDVTIIRGGSTVATGNVTTFSTTGTNTTQQVIDWDVSSVLPAGGLLPNDVVQTRAHYAVATNDLPELDIQTGVNYYMYILSRQQIRVNIVMS